MRTHVRRDDEARPKSDDFALLPQEISFSSAASEKATIWKRTTLPLADFVSQMSNHRAGRKGGSAWSPAVFEDGRRKSGNAAEIGVAVFDCDRGQRMSTIRATLFVEGFAAIIVSSHSHGATETEISERVWSDWRKDNPKGTPADFMRMRGYDEAVACGATLVHADKAKLIIEHQPCSRFRVILFPEKPWRRADYSDFGSAEKAYKSGLGLLAKQLDLMIDENCLDLARLFFDPRHAEGVTPVSYFVPGYCVAPWNEEFCYESASSVKSAADRREMKTGRKKFDSFDELASAVRAVRNDERFRERDMWLKFGAAIHFEADGSEEGLALWQEWSAGCTCCDNDPKENERVWRSYRRPK